MIALLAAAATTTGEARGLVAGTGRRRRGRGRGEFWENFSTEENQNTGCCALPVVNIFLPILCFGVPTTITSNKKDASHNLCPFVLRCTPGMTRRVRTNEPLQPTLYVQGVREREREEGEKKAGNTKRGRTYKSPWQRQHRHHSGFVFRGNTSITKPA